MTTTKPTGLAILAAITIVAVLIGAGLTTLVANAIGASGVTGLTQPAPNQPEPEQTRLGNHRQSCYPAANWTAGAKWLRPCISIDRPAADGSTWLWLQTKNPWRPASYAWTCRVPSDVRALTGGLLQIDCYVVRAPQ